MQRLELAFRSVYGVSRHTHSDEVSICADGVTILCSVLPGRDNRVDDPHDRHDESRGELSLKTETR